MFNFWRKTSKSKVPLTVLRPLQQNEAANVEIVFIHGLDGDALTTWNIYDGVWVDALSSAFPDANIWTLQYRLSATKWRGGAMPLHDRAINILAVMSSQLKQDTPIVFICHSYGGLLVKQLLRNGLDLAAEYVRLAERVSGFIFFSTPHTGSSTASYVDGLLKSLPLCGLLRLSGAVDELKRNAPALRELNIWFRSRALKCDWPMLVYYETMDTFGMRIVDETAADPGGRVTAVGVDANHFDICKPETADFRVHQTIELISRVISKFKPTSRCDSPLQRVLMAKNEELPYLRVQLQSELALDPGSVQTRFAIVQIETMRHNGRTLTRYCRNSAKGNGLASSILWSVIAVGTALSVVIGFHDHVSEALKAMVSLLIALIPL